MHEIFDPLSLSFKLHHWNFIYLFILLIKVIKIWPKLLIETKENENYYKIVNMNTMSFKTS